MNDRITLTPVQLAYAKSVRMIEMHLEPKCEGCGYGADRPKCAMDMGGHCQRHEQADVRAFDRVRDALLDAGGLRGRDLYGWRYDLPLDVLYSFSETEKALLLDLHDRGGKQSTRKIDERFDTLGCGGGVAKGAVLLSASGDRWHIHLTDRGKELVSKWLLEAGVAHDEQPESEEAG
jgi:hypothetical protein